MPTIYQQAWVDQLAQNLIPDNSAINFSIDDSERLNGRTVQLPQAGSRPEIVKNRAVGSLPVAPVADDHTILGYTIDEYTSTPSLVQITPEVERSYALRQEVLQEHINEQTTRLADEAFYAWAPPAASADFIVRTSGAARDSLGDDQTGNRLAVAKADIIALRTRLSRNNVPVDGSVLLIDENLYSDILAIPGFIEADKYGAANLPSGAIGRLYGLNVFTRTNTVRYDNAATPEKKVVGAANAGTDNLSIIAWNPGFVRRAVGTSTNQGIKIFQDIDAPGYYGSIFSTLVRGGFSPKYASRIGIAALVESASA